MVAEQWLPREVAFHVRVVKLIPQERIQQRTVEKMVDVLGSGDPGTD